MQNIMKRHEVPSEMKWNTEDLFKNKQAFFDALTDLKLQTEELKKYKGHLLDDAFTLYEAVVKLEDLSAHAFRLGAYTSLNQAVDATNLESQELEMKFSSAATKMATEITFFENEIMGLSNETYNSFLKDEPKLENYRVFIDDLLDLKRYQLSDETEEALAALGEVTNAPYGIYSISKAADMVFDSFKNGKGETLPNSFNLFEGKYEYSEDQVTRKNAYESFNKTLKQYKNTYATIYATEVKKHIALSRLRGYKSATEMLLKEQKVTEAMYNRQLDIIYKELAPHMQKFAKLLKEQLGLDNLHFYDLKAPLDTSFNPSATYEEAKNVVLKSLAVMGEDYVAIIKKAFDENWIDYADNVGKSTGAFCETPYGSHPYILVTFQHNMRDAFTLTHELGHAGHFYLANKEQSYFNTEPSLYTIEAPSTMNEMLLGRYLLENNDDPRMKKWVILQFMGTYYHNFVTHLLEAVYQRRVYEHAEKNQPITADFLSSTKFDVIKGFWGDTVEVDDDAGMTWMRQPHYYMGLYPYTYSAGLTASTACSAMIYEEGQPAVERWIKMLKAGGKFKPQEQLKIAGMDFTTDEPVLKAVSYVGDLIDQLIDLSH